ncbi:hypothetical protein D3C71_1700120 [compost metagenome]
MACISISLTLIDGMLLAGRACAGRSPHGNGPATSRATVLAWVGLAPVPFSTTRYWAPPGSSFTPALALLALMKVSLLALFSDAALSHSALAFSAWRFCMFCTAVRSWSTGTDGCFFA